MTDSELVNFMLVNAIAHLLEFIDTGEEMDYIAAMGNMAHLKVTQYTQSLSVVDLPARRDGKPALEMGL